MKDIYEKILMGLIEAILVAGGIAIITTLVELFLLFALNPL